MLSRVAPVFSLLLSALASHRPHLHTVCGTRIWENKPSNYTGPFFWPHSLTSELALPAARLTVHGFRSASSW